MKSGLFAGGWMPSLSLKSITEKRKDWSGNSGGAAGLGEVMFGTDDLSLIPNISRKLEICMPSGVPGLEAHVD